MGVAPYLVRMSASTLNLKRQDPVVREDIAGIWIICSGGTKAPRCGSAVPDAKPFGAEPKPGAKTA